jgi:hypothetical protein
MNDRAASHARRTALNVLAGAIVGAVLGPVQYSVSGSTGALTFQFLIGPALYVRLHSSQGIKQ